MKAKAKLTILLSALYLFAYIDSVAQGAFTCSDKFYLSAGVGSATGPTQLYEGTIGSTALTALGPATVSYNTIAYNPLDNYIYGISGDHLVRIGNDGLTTDLGVITGGGFTSSVNWVAGTCLSTGELIFRSNSSPTTPVYKIDIATLTATVFTNSLSLRVADMVYDSVDNLVYAVYSTTNELVSIDMAGTVTVLGVMTPTVAPSSGLFSNSMGEIFSVYGDAQSIYEIDKTTLSCTLVSTYSMSPFPGSLDATTCQAGGALPVTLVSFVAKPLESSMELNWKTTLEDNSSHFDVERSGDGKTWRVIGTVNAMIQSSVETNYGFTDLTPLAENYYRLKMVDRDGSHAYSRILAVEAYALPLMVFPNPTSSDELTIRGLKGGERVDLFDLSGRILKTWIPRIPGQLKVEARIVKQGTYVLRVQDVNGAKHTYRIIRK